MKAINALLTLLKGVVIGIANAIPGVSGGTMAVILKIYDQFLNAISLSPKKLKENWRFLIFIGGGMLLGILLAAKVLGFLFEHYSGPTQLFFWGIIIGSIPLIWREVLKSDTRYSGKLFPPGIFTPLNILVGLLGLGLVLATAFMTGDVETLGESASALKFSLPLGIYLVVVMFVAAIAMLLPGLSGSFVLLLLGGYQTVITAVNSLSSPNFDVLAVLFSTALGAGLGLLLGAKGIATLLKKYRLTTYWGILGLILGSLYAIFPTQGMPKSQIAAGVVLVIVGIALPNLMELPSKRKV